MMSKIFLKILFITIFLLNSFLLLEASTDGSQIELNVNYCNHDNICNPLEDFLSCPSDCFSSCNNNICEIGENSNNCPNDCSTVIVPVNKGVSSGSYIFAENFFRNLMVEVGPNKAIVRWDSSVLSSATLKWGTTGDYKDGVIRNINFLLNHKIEINNLKEGTVYYFNIQAEDLSKRSRLIENQTFQTLSLPDTKPPGNPTDVFATSVIPGINISWINPKEKDFDYIRVIKNKERYYGDPFKGEVVYEGRGIYFTDNDVFVGKKYYYSLFSRDKIGNYSSGSLVSIIYDISNKDKIEIILPSEDKIEILKENYIIKQGLMSYDFKIGDIFSLDGDNSFSIKTDYNSQNKDDDLWVEIKNKEKNTIIKYFFYKTKDVDGFFEAIIPPLLNEGYYNVSIHRYQDGIDRTINQGAFYVKNIIKEKLDYHSLYLLLFIILISTLFFGLLFIFLRKIFKKSN